VEHDEQPLPVGSIEMVAIDVDGTLLRGDGNVSAANVAALRAAVAAGKRVVLATARPPRGVAVLCERLGLTSLQVNHNGALIFDPVSRQPVFHQPLAGALARQVIDVARRHDPSLAIGVEVIDRFNTDRMDTQLGAERSLDLSNADVSGLDEPLRGEVTKLMMIGDTGKLGAIQDELGTRGKGRVGFAFSHMRLLQVVHAKATKADALERVVAHYGLTASQVMAIGDAPNDLPMLRWAGLGVAVANAWQTVRSAARLVVPSNDDDGVAYAIRRHMLDEA
jgi:Cof subfamily protein (haloacid dehalogenase superfamily)